MARVLIIVVFIFPVVVVEVSPIKETIALHNLRGTVFLDQNANHPGGTPACK